jgi:hypothetical protein
MSLTRCHTTSLRRLILASMLLPRLAPAQQANAASVSKVECAQAFENAQRLRNSARYLEATREVRTCVNPSCGAALMEECGKIYGELEAATPSVVFAARDGGGKELSRTTVRIDDGGSPLALDGKPVALDPGSHTFVFSAEGFPPQTESAVIRAGERFRPIAVVLQAPPPSRPPTSVADTSSRDLGPRPRVPLGAYVLSGVAVAGVGGFVGFRLWGAHDFDELSRTCKPDCASSSVDAVRQKYLVSTVSLAVGAAAAVGAVTWYFAARPSAADGSARVQVSPSADGVSARFSTSF